MSTITDFFDTIWEFFTVTVWETLKDFFLWVWQSFRVWAYEQATEVVEWIGTFIEFCAGATGDLFVTFQNYYANMPDIALGVLTLTQVPAALCILFGAFTIRLTIRIVLAVVF